MADYIIDEYVLPLTAQEIEDRLNKVGTLGDVATEDIVPIEKGGTGANNAEEALKNLGITASAEELNYVDGVTSDIQTQFNNKVPKTRKVNGKALSSNITLLATDVGAVKNGGVRGEDGGHKMAMSWNGSAIIVGIDDNAAVKTLVTDDDKKLKDSGFWAPYQSTNFVMDGSAPFSVFIRKIGSLVFYEFDLTTKYALTSTEENAKLVTYNILDNAYRPNMTIYKMVTVVNGKPVWFRFDPSGDKIHIFGDEIPIGTRLCGTWVWMGQ